MPEQRVVVITGASSGIGRGTALRFAKRHDAVVLAARRLDALRELAEECVAVGGAALVVPTDVSDQLQVQRLATAAVHEFGRIDVWVNDAAVSVFAPVAEVPMDEFRRVLDVNVLGYVYGARSALEVMLRQGSGTIIDVSSIVGEVPQPYTAAYSMSKAAVRALGVSLRSELALQKAKGLHVVTVLPPTVDTPFFAHAANHTGRRILAMPPVYSVDKVAAAIVRAADVPRNEIVVGRLGRMMVRQHRRTPTLVEGQMALQVEKTHLSPREPAPDTTGNLFEPPPDAEATAAGGWGGRRRTAGRLLLAGLLTLGLAAAGQGWRARRA